VNAHSVTWPRTDGPLYFVFERDPDPDAAARGAGGGGGAFEGTRTLPCLALVQVASDGLDGAAAPGSGRSKTAGTDATSNSDGRSKSLMIPESQRASASK